MWRVQNRIFSRMCRPARIDIAGSLLNELMPMEVQHACQNCSGRDRFRESRFHVPGVAPGRNRQPYSLDLRLGLFANTRKQKLADRSDREYYIWLHSLYNYAYFFDIYIYIHIHIHIHTHTHTHTDIDIHIHIHIHRHTHTRICKYIYIYVRVCVHINTYVYTE